MRARVHHPTSQPTLTFYRSSVPKQRLRTTLRRLTFSSILATLSSTRPPASDREGAGPVSFFLPKTLFMVCYLALPLLLAPGVRSCSGVLKCKDMEGGPQIAGVRFFSLQNLSVSLAVVFNFVNLFSTKRTPKYTIVLRSCLSIPFYICRDSAVTNCCPQLSYSRAATERPQPNQDTSECSSLSVAPHLHLFFAFRVVWRRPGSVVDFSGGRQWPQQAPD